MLRQPSVMKHDFSKVPRAEIPRSSFDRSHGVKSTFDGGYLVPFFVDEALPGDTFNLQATGFARLATPIKPIMDNMFMDTFFFAVPYRLVWDNWAKFNGEQANPGDSTDYVIPQMVSPGGGYAANSLSDYFGLPTGVGSLSHSALFHRAYNLIWNEWFRDQNLQNAVVVDKDDGPDNPADYVLLRRGKRHDYFTSCLPWPQKGPEVNIPIGSSAPVTGTATLGNSVQQTVHRSDTSASLGNLQGDGSVYLRANAYTGDEYISGVVTHSLTADLSGATAATINQLREAFQVQRMYERDARGGTRYTELVRAHFGVISPDQRLQRPEYLGGATTMVSIREVEQTSATGAGTPQGNLAAIGTATAHGHGFTHSFTEHCILIGMLNVRADLSYQQGLNRMWSRQTRLDFYWPALSHLGEQSVLNKEIYCTGGAADDQVFGYQERYAEYRYKPSIITGEFRSQFPQSLDYWHLAQEFASLPVLNGSFIQDTPPIDRVIQVQDEPHFLFDAYIKLKCARPMPVYGVPGLIDHF